MQVELENGIEIDLCPHHGVWLDNGELRSILDLARGRSSAQYARTYQAISDAKRDGKIAGALLGFWSLLLD